MEQETVKSDRTYHVPRPTIIGDDEICALLDGASLVYRKSETHIDVKQCPFCNPDTTDPTNQWKLGVMRDVGAFNCFRCETKGSWKNLKDRLQTADPKANGAPPVEGKSTVTAAKEIWEVTVAADDVKAKPLRDYLLYRGLSGLTPDSIRFCSSLAYHDRSRSEWLGNYPTMVAKITDQTGKFMGVHRTYLTPSGLKAEVVEPKKMLGAAKGGAVHFDAAKEIVAVTEGIETGLAVREGTGLPVWAALSASGLEALQIPHEVTTVYIWGDQDSSKTGERSANRLARRMYDAGKRVFVLIPPRELLDPGKKSKDWLDIRNFDAKKELLQTYFRDAVPWSPTNIREFVKDPVFPDRLSPAAYYGLAGDFVRMIEPHTEADPTALLISFLICYGNVIDHKSYYALGSARHYLNLYSVLVGETSTGRKGTALGEILNQFKEVVPDWFRSCRKSGLSSGEGVIHHIRDRVEKEKQIKDSKTGESKTEKVIDDEGVIDKRLMVTEPEFAAVLQMANRDSNILSTVLRQAWDGDTLRTLSKNSPECATEAHISILSHITPHELRRRLSDTDQRNGFGNRFTWLCVKRSKQLPFPKDTDELDFIPLRDRLQQAIQYGHDSHKIIMDETARSIWISIYTRLSTPPPGLFGDMIGRAPSQIQRLASVYCLLDRTNVINSDHLKAALAVWEHCEASCKYLFGNYFENPAANRILEELRKTKHGLTRTEIRDLFDRHKKSSEIQETLDFLQFEGLADKRVENTNGRPVTWWFATEQKSGDLSDKSAERGGHAEE
ncbi:MAG: toprim domain-containing protein [Bdellovibrionota bacterium]